MNAKLRSRMEGYELVVADVLRSVFSNVVCGGIVAMHHVKRDWWCAKKLVEVSGRVFAGTHVAMEQPVFMPAEIDWSPMGHSRWSSVVLGLCGTEVYVGVRGRENGGWGFRACSDRFEIGFRIEDSVEILFAYRYKRAKEKSTSFLVVRKGTRHHLIPHPCTVAGLQAIVEGCIKAKEECS